MLICLNVVLSDGYLAAKGGGSAAGLGTPTRHIWSAIDTGGYLKPTLGNQSNSKRKTSTLKSTSLNKW